MSIKRLNTKTRMSSIVIHNETVYLCGQVGAGSTVAEQTSTCLDRIDGLLAQAGSSRSDVLQAIIWLRDMADFDAMNAVWDAWVPEGHAPARACGEARLAAPELKVEIIITAALAEQSAPGLAGDEGLAQTRAEPVQKTAILPHGM